MKNIIYCLLFSMVTMFSCSEKMPLFDTSNIYVQFVNEAEEFSFKAYPGQTKVSYPIAITIHGMVLDSPREIKISADTASTAIEGVHYEFEEKYEMAADTLASSIYVNFILTEDMDLTSYSLVLNIDDIDNAYRGEIIQTTITFNNFIAQPSWWQNSANNIIYTNFLGEYSSLKYEYFMQVTGETTLEGWSYTDAYAVTREFQNWLDAQSPAILELDGSEMTTVL